MIDFRSIFNGRVSGDVFRMRATAIVIALFAACSAHADLDYSVNFVTRSFPLSGELAVDAGYGFLLWGQHEANSPFYGYIRPRIELGTAGYWNGAQAAVDLYPISFFGFSAGGESIQNDKDYTAYDCSLYQCRGRNYRTFAQAELSAAYSRVYAQVRFKRERWSLDNPGTRMFLDTTSGLPLSQYGDSQTGYRALVGVKVTEKWSLNGVYVYTQSDNSHQVEHFPFALVRYQQGDIGAGVGAGVYSSTIKGPGGTALVFLSWNIKPGLPLSN